MDTSHIGPFAQVDTTGLTASLNRLITVFKRDYEGLLHDPDLVRDRCEEISHMFALRCHDIGITATVITGARFGEVPEFPETRLMLNGHFATLIHDADTVIDWTARQFSRDAEVPLIQSRTQWRHTWEPLAP